MIRETAHALGGIGIYGIFSMILFLGFFMGALVWALFLKKPYLRHMSHLPLESDTTGVAGENDHE